MANLIIKSIEDEESREEIICKIKEIEELSINLRCELEELQDLMWNADCVLTDDDDCEIDSYQVEDWASKVSEIENAFEED